MSGVGFQHPFLLSLLNLQSEVSWLSGFCQMENNSSAMSYLTGRAHSDELGQAAEAAEIPVKLPSDSPRSPVPRENRQDAERWAEQAMRSLP